MWSSCRTDAKGCLQESARQDRFDFQGHTETAVDPIGARRADLVLRYLEYLISRPADTYAAIALAGAKKLAESAAVGWVWELTSVLRSAGLTVELCDITGASPSQVADLRRRLHNKAVDDLYYEINASKRRISCASGWSRKTTDHQSSYAWLCATTSSSRMKLTGRRSLAY